MGRASTRPGAIFIAVEVSQGPHDAPLAPMRAAAMAGFAESWRREEAMAKATTKLSAEDRVILFCAAAGIDHAAVGILAHAMQSMAIRGFITHDRESGAYALTDSGRATLTAILADAGVR